ncbi:hypothetical protein ABKN59_009339, partial [Abortiporus biennis]
MKANRAFIALDVALVAFCVYDTLRRRDFEKRRSRRCEESPRESEKTVKSSASRESIGQPPSSSQKLNLPGSCSTTTIAKVEQQIPTTVDDTSSIVQQEREDGPLGCAPSSETAEPSSSVRNIYDVDISTLPPLPPSPLLSASNSFEHPEGQEVLELDLSTLPPLPPSSPPSPSPSFVHFEEQSVLDLHLSSLPPLPPSPLLSASSTFEHLEEQSGFELDLSTLPPLPRSPLLSPSFERSEEQGGLDFDLSMLPPLPPSPLLSPSPSFSHFEEENTRVNFDLELDLGAIEEWVVIDLSPEEKEDIVGAGDNVEDVSKESPAEEESSSRVEDHSLAHFEEGPTLVQDENASEAKIDIAVQLEVTSVEEFLETVALVPSASLHEFERPAESEMKIPSSTSSPSKLGLYLRSADFGTSVVTSPAAEIEDSKVASTGAQPEVTKKTPA